MADKRAYARRLARYQEYMDAVHREAERLTRPRVDPARQAAYEELMQAGESEAAEMALHGSEQ